MNMGNHPHHNALPQTITIPNELSNETSTHKFKQTEAGVVLREFSDDGIDTIANLASEVNSSVENIGARRLHTIIEKVLDDISFIDLDQQLKNLKQKQTLLLENKYSQI